MPRFSYQYQPEDLTNTITALMTQGGQQAAQALLQASQLQAQGTMGAGQAWGQGLRNLGQMPTTYMKAMTQKNSNYQNMVNSILGASGGMTGLAPLGMYPADYYSALSGMGGLDSGSAFSIGTPGGNIGSVVNTMPDLSTILGY